MKRPPLAALLAFPLRASAGLAPGVDIQPAPSDFAFLEIQLQG